jgi:sulfopyruvate decarboxylase subunit alpha|tara:strand:+ start:718 stop:1206 length:489 start_codon:yes stop_codon:yes gene_type:complete
LTNSFQIKTFNFFQKNDVKNFIGVPDSTLKEFISSGLKNKKIIVTTREEEAIGIATGMCMSGSNSLVFMQNAGFANSLSTITSLVKLYKIPIIFLIGWRGYLKDDAPEHTMIGKIQPDLIKTIELPSKILSENNWEKNCKWALKKIKNNSPCALIVKREFHD